MTVFTQVAAYLLVPRVFHLTTPPAVVEPAHMRVTGFEPASAYAQLISHHDCGTIV